MNQLTLKQRRFITAYLENGGNGRLAAQAAGYKGNPHTLEQIAYENLRKPEIGRALSPALDAAGITPEAVTKKLSEMMHAEPEGKPTFDHVLRALFLAMRVNGMLKAESQSMHISTMNLIKLQPQITGQRHEPSVETVGGSEERLVEVLEARDE